MELIRVGLEIGTVLVLAVGAVGLFLNYFFW
jgi:hypothetical protein